MSAYVVKTCEDTGRPALYRVIEHGGGPALLLVAHKGDFFDIYEALASALVEDRSDVIPPP